MNFCAIINFCIPILQSLIAGYLLLVLVKVYSFAMFRRFLGSYSEIPSSPSEADYLKKIKFKVSYNWCNLFTPVLNISININRKNTVEHDSMDWTGIYHSDILNLFYFKGIYIITNPGPGDSNGWHEMLCFDYRNNGKKRMRIAFRVNYIKIGTRQWISDGGYYIEKDLR